MAKEKEPSQEDIIKTVGNPEAIKAYLVGDDWGYADVVVARENGQADRLQRD